MRTSVHCSTLYNSQDMEAPKMSTDRGMDKENGILFSHKKNEIMSCTATWMDLEIIILSEVRERQISNEITNVWSLKEMMR